MKSYKTYSDSNYLRKEDFPQPEILHLEGMREEEVTAPGKKPKLKLIAYFKEYEKGIVTNLAHGAVLEALTGSDDPAKWNGGLRVKVYNDPTVTFGGQVVGGIRFAPAEKPTRSKSARKSIPKPVIPDAGPVKTAVGKQVDEDGQKIPF